MVAGRGNLTITQANYLDLANLLFNEIIGSVALTLIIGFIIVTWMGVRYKWGLDVTFALVLLWVGLVSSYALQSLALMIVVLVVATVIYTFFPKLWRR